MSSKRSAARRALVAIVAVTLSVALIGCTLNGRTQRTGEKVPEDSRRATTAGSITETGNGDFSFEGPGKFADHPIRVWYNAPPGSLADAHILIVMTGAQRDGEAYRADWVPLVAGQKTLLLVPEFSEKEYPGVSSYNLGGMVDRRGKLQPDDTWNFQLIELLFDHVIADIGSSATDYAIFGHSAGAQFVHRFVEFMPHSRARLAVAANAGWYTVPDDETEFPYGTDGAPLASGDMAAAFSRRLIVMLGADDTDPNDESLQRDTRTDTQGKNRLLRGLFYYQAARKAAGTSMPFNWQLVTVPGVAHSHKDMARAAAPYLLSATPSPG